jgi:predicted signal transduction protein with EAL and GGDEF domain
VPQNILLIQGDSLGAKAVSEALHKSGDTKFSVEWVVAEGVETRGQLLFLEENGCTEAQGFYFSRPLNADGFGHLLRKAS